MARSPKVKVSDEAVPLGRELLELGATGLQRHGGFISEEFHPKLTFRQGLQTFREMQDNDPVVGAVLFAMTALLRQAEWSVQPADESQAALDAVEFVESVMHDMDTSWADVVAEACSMFTYGFAPMEIVYKRRMGRGTRDKTQRSKYDDGLYGVRKLSLRAPDSLQNWLFDDDGDVVGMVQHTTERGTVVIPADKLLLLRTTTLKGNPEGRSLLRTAYRPWFYKKRLEEIEGIGVERDLAGLPVVLLPAKYMRKEASDSDKALFAAFRTLAMQIRRDASEGVTMPSDRDDKGNLLFDLKLLSAGGTRQFDTTKIIDRYDRRIAGTVLADFIFLGQQAVGSFALSSDKTAMFATALGGYLDIIADTMNRQLIERLWAINGLDFNIMPTLQPGDVESPDLAVLAGFISTLAGAGMPLFPDRELENHLRHAAGMPMAPEEGPDGDLTLPGFGPDGEDGAISEAELATRASLQRQGISTQRQPPAQAAPGKAPGKAEDGADAPGE